MTARGLAAAIALAAILALPHAGHAQVGGNTAGPAPLVAKGNLKVGGCIAVGQPTCAANDPVDILATTTGGVRIINSTATALNNDVRQNSSGHSALFGIGGASYSSNAIAADRAVFAGNGSDVLIWTIGANNILFATGGGATTNERARITSGGAMVIGGGAMTGSPGELGLTKIAASGTAPGAGFAKIALVCGTNSGSAKLIAYAGTSTTPVTILDNIGAGVTGC